VVLASDRAWWTTIVLACAGGAFGEIAGTLWGFALQGSFLESNVDAAGMGALCAGIGWFAGATFGLERSRDGRTAGGAWVWILRSSAIAFLVAGVLVARWVPSMDDYRPLAELGPLQRDIMLDAVLGAITLLIVAWPTGPIRRALEGAAVAIAVVLVLLLGVSIAAIP
jgi:hypothetical protein